MGRRALSFESDNWFVGLHFVAKSPSSCLDLILGDGSSEFSVKSISGQILPLKKHLQLVALFLDHVIFFLI